MKKIYLLAAAAALFAACSSDKASLDTPQQPTQLEEGAVGFDAYTQRATTRGGWTGSLTTSILQGFGTATPKGGFGVFGYYTDNNEYDQRSTPNFFYNQLVYYSAGSWEYEPVKYWPNEYGANANSDDADKVTYFAYAPWIEVVPTSGKLAKLDGESDTQLKEREQWGITAMTRNANQGDPILKYIASFNKDKSVDLCWGVADNGDGQWPIVKDGSKQDIADGEPWVDVQRPANTNQRVKFTFKHATAQMQVKIDADVDVDGHGHTNEVANKTRVWVRSVTFKGFAMKGSLNLHNDDANKAKWLDYNGQNELVAEDVTVYDGRKDGKEGVNGAVATNEKVLGLNPTLVQDGLYRDNSGKTVNETDNAVYTKGDAIKVIGTDGTSERAGVTNIPVNLFENGDLFHVIPTDDNFAIEIVYDIETVSENLAQNLSDGATKGSSIENRISKTITFGDATKLLAGHSYKLNLHLGMNSVKFDAAVTDWIEEPIQDVDLPLNVPLFSAGSPGTGSATIAYDATDFTFAINGFNGGESMNSATNFVEKQAHGATSPSAGQLDGWALTKAKNAANTAGIAIQTLTTAVNPNTTDQLQTVKWVGNQSSKELTMTFTQLAHPLFMQITGFENDGSNGKITLTRYDDENHTSSANWGANGGWFCNGNGEAITDANDDPESTSPANGIAVYRNGIKLTWIKAGETLGTNKYKFSDAGTDKYTNTITIFDKLQAGDVIKVVLKTGDAPIETVSAVVGGITFPFTSRTVTYLDPSFKTYDDFGVQYYGSASDPNITYDSSDDSIADVDAAGKVTTKSVGEVTITATLTSSNKLDFPGSVSYSLKINPQESTISGFEDKTESKDITAPIASETDVVSWNDLKAVGSRSCYT